MRLIHLLTFIVLVASINSTLGAAIVTRANPADNGEGSSSHPDLGGSNNDAEGGATCDSQGVPFRLYSIPPDRTPDLAEAQTCFVAWVRVGIKASADLKKMEDQGIFPHAAANALKQSADNGIVEIDWNSLKEVLITWSRHAQDQAKDWQRLLHQHEGKSDPSEEQQPEFFPLLHVPPNPTPQQIRDNIEAYTLSLSNMRKVRAYLHPKIMVGRRIMLGQKVKNSDIFEVDPEILQHLQELKDMADSMVYESDNQSSAWLRAEKRQEREAFLKPNLPPRPS